MPSRKLLAMPERLPRSGLPHPDLSGCDLPGLGLLNPCTDFDSHTARWDGVEAIGGWAATLDHIGCGCLEAGSTDCGVELVDVFACWNDEARVEAGRVLIAGYKMLFLQEDDLEPLVIDEPGKFTVAEDANLAEGEDLHEEAAEVRDIRGRQIELVEFEHYDPLRVERSRMD